MIDPIHETEERCSDKASAHRVATRHQRELMWVKGLGFLTWDGRRWVRDDARAYSIAALAGAYAREEARKFYDLSAQAKEKAQQEELKKKGDSIWSWGRTSENDPRVRGTLNHLRAMVGRDFSEIDAHPMLLNVVNGVLDLETGKLHSHDPALYLTALSPMEYHPDAPAPKWKAQMEWMFGGCKGMIDYVQRMAGSALAAQADRLLHFFHGKGSNGKNILADTLRGVLGDDYSLQAPPDLLLSSRGDRHPAELASLRGKRLVTVSEIEQDRAFHLQRLKSLTGDRTISARFMRQDWMSFPRTWTLVMLANHPPKVNDTTDSSWDRLRKIPCRARVSLGDQIRDYDLLLVSEEGAGILAWAVEGCERWQEHGMPEVPAIVEESAAYRRESDTVGRFLDDGGCQHTPAGLAPALEFWRCYERFCEELGLDPIRRRDFPAELAQRGIHRVKRAAGVMYCGVTLVADPTEDTVQ